VSTPDDRAEDGPLDVPDDGPETLAEERLLSSLGRQARAVNLARVVRLVELLDSADAGALDDVDRHEAESLAHQVVGSAGTFGFPAASVDAVAIEEYFGVDPPGSGATSDAGLVRRTLERLRSEFSG
jgi:HPt (histidine-containing phosphotransfer) domain-containing protein